MLNRIVGEIVTVTTIGNRARIGLSVPQPMTAEVTIQSSERLSLRPGASVIAAWKASPTRLIGM